MARKAGISGVAVAMAAAGGLLLWTGIANRPITDALRDLVQGRPPGTSGSPTGPALAEIETDLDQFARNVASSGAGGGAAGSGGKTPAAAGAVEEFVSIALAQLGKPYRWGAAGPSAFDCSGLVTFALKGAGLDNTRRVTSQYLIWDGAFNVNRDQAARGDLVCWTGHIGIALTGDTMVHAPSFGRPVQRGNIWSQPPPQIRRLRAQSRKRAA